MFVNCVWWFSQELRKNGARIVVRCCDPSYDVDPLKKEGISVLVSWSTTTAVVTVLERVFVHLGLNWEVKPTKQRASLLHVFAKHLIHAIGVW